MNRQIVEEDKSKDNLMTPSYKKKRAKDTGMLSPKNLRKSVMMKDKYAEILKFEEGSLRSKDMLIESQTSTIKININQSDNSSRSFYSEVNQSRRLDVKDEKMPNFRPSEEIMQQIIEV